MKNILKAIEIFTVFMVGLFLFGSLIYSEVTGKPVSEIINWDWWVIFLIASIWLTQQRQIIFGNKNSSAK